MPIIPLGFTSDVMDSNDDLSSYRNMGIYWIRQANCPVKGGTLLVLSAGRGYSTQLLIGEETADTGGIVDGYIRTTSAWDQTYGEWKRIVS